MQEKKIQLKMPFFASSATLIIYNYDPLRRWISKIQRPHGITLTGTDNFGYSQTQ